MDSWCPRDHCTAENLSGLDTNLLLNNLLNILVIIIIKLVLIYFKLFLNSVFQFLHENEKRTVFCFPFFYENGKRIKVLEIQTKNLLDMKMTANYLNFVFRIEVKT